MTRYTGPTVSREQPWPGLMPFTEEASAFFHGRDEEVAELMRLIRRQPLTVLFGLSGLGKSSLLNAGLFPRLREEDFLPVYIRLDVLSATPFAEQVMTVIAANAARHGVEAPAARAGETLWEYFHGRHADFWSAKNRLLTPVLVFDQFEELFTLGRHAPEVARRCRDFLEALADLVEGRTPPQVIAMLERDPARGEALDFSRATYKVLLSFREDYLPDFEGLRGVMPSIMRGRLRLTRMNGSQARAAILESGGHLVSEAVCDRIIRFVASARGGHAEATELERLEIEPALLSVVCRELNGKRIANGQSQISADLLESGAQQEIIREFYEESLVDIDPRVGEFIEDQLLTEAGYRDSYALDDALGIPGVTREAIDTLIARRVLRLDERAGVVRVELTHDVLTRVAKESRDRRKEREAARVAQMAEAARRRKVRGWLALGAVVLVASIGLATTFALLLERSNEEKRRLVETQSNVLLDQAIGQLERHVPSEPQAILAEAMRLNPSNAAAVARAVTYLSQRSFGHETAERKLESPASGIDLRARAAFVLTKAPGFSVIDLESGATLAPERKVERAPTAMAISADRSRIAWDEGEGVVAVARLSGGEKARIELDGPDQGSPIKALAFSPEGNALLVRALRAPRLYLLEAAPVAVSIPDHSIPDATPESPLALGPGGEWMAFGGRRGVLLWNRVANRFLSFPHPSPVNALAFSEDGAFLATGSQDKNARLWELQTGRLVGAPLPHEGAVLSTSLASQAQRMVTGSLDRTARIWALPASTPLAEPLVASTPIIQARLQDDGARATTLDASGRWALWAITPAESARPLLAANERVLVMEASPDGARLAVASEALLRVFDISASPGQAAVLWSVPIASEGRRPVSLRFSADGSRLAVASREGVVELRDKQGAVVATLPQARAARLMEFSPDGQSLAIASEDDAVRVWRLDGARMQGLPLSTASAVTRLEFAPASDTLLVAERSGRIRLWDAASTLSIAAIETRNRVAYAGFTGRGLELVVIEERLARIFDVRREAGKGFEVRVLSQLPFLNTVWSADLHAPSHRMVVGGVDGTARLVELDPLRLSGSAMKHDGVVVGVGFSPDGRWLVSRTEQSSRLWDARTGFPVSDTLRYDNRLASAALLGKGAYLVTSEESAGPQLTRASLDFPLPYPPWLPKLLELAGRGRFDKTGTVAPIENARAELDALRAAVTAGATSAWWKDWGLQVLARLDGKPSGAKP